MIASTTKPGDTILDIMSGSATFPAVAKKLDRKSLGFELSAAYAESGNQRLASVNVGDAIA